ncbi:MAG: VOC family protein [Candidatus Caldarchaeum sp.]
MTTQPLDPRTTIQWVSLTVSSLQMSSRFYKRVMGLSSLYEWDGGVVLGTPPKNVLVMLVERKGVAPKPPDRRGLYHFALLLPSRKDLACMFVRLGEFWELDGASDHLVSEAVYLQDPDGHGIEVYHDRPREAWPKTADGRIRMATLPLNLDSLLAELRGEGTGRALDESWRLGEGTRLGHIHLHVSRLEKAESFYHGLLGFDIVFRMGSALFMSTGGYHHHVGVNTWAGVDAPPPSDEHASLRSFAINVVKKETLSRLVDRLAGEGCSVAEGLVSGMPGFEGATVEDFDGNRVELVLSAGDQD